MKTRLPPSLSRWSVLALLVAGACTDNPVAPSYQPEPRLLTTEYQCTVDVAAATTSCRLSTSAASGPRLDVLPGSGPLTFVSSWAHSRGNAANEDTSTNTLSFTNNMGQPIGTTDGINAHANGNRLFFTTIPYVTKVSSGTVSSASIQLVTPDGTASFTNPEATLSYSNRPYYQYSGIVAPGNTSTSRTVQYVYSANVVSFAFGYRVSAPVQYEYGWASVSPASVAVLGPGETATLTATVYNAFGVVQGDGVTWASSDPGVAAVDPLTGEVTALGEGTTTITATSNVNAQRTGTRVVTVDAAPEVLSTDPVENATSIPPASDIIIYFDEPVNVSTSSFTLECPSGWFGTFTVSGSGTSTITLNPNSNLPAATVCDVTVVANQVSDVDTNDGPDLMAGNYAFSFTTS